MSTVSKKYVPLSCTTLSSYLEASEKRKLTWTEETTFAKPATFPLLQTTKFKETRNLFEIERRGRKKFEQKQLQNVIGNHEHQFATKAKGRTGTEKEKTPKYLSCRFN
jgi:hypothetical protein